MIRTLNASRLATYSSTMLRLHDERKWSEFKRCVANYVEELGYDLDTSKKVAEEITRAYKYADIASQAQNKKDIKLEDLSYAKVIDHIKKAHLILGIETRSLIYKERWYISLRHKDHFGVMWNLFMEQGVKYNWRPLLVLKTSYILFRYVYPAHAKHNWKNLNLSLLRYWKVVCSYYQEKAPLEL